MAPLISQFKEFSPALKPVETSFNKKKNWFPHGLSVL